jgi:hypothetical protein
MTVEGLALVLFGVFGFGFTFVAGIGLAMVAVEWLRKKVGVK